MVAGIIDVHHHVRTRAMAEAAAGAGVGMGGGAGREWTPEAAIEGMDATGIAVAVLSPVIFITGIADAGAAAPVLRATNDYLADVIRRWPDRFGAFAPIPLGETEAACTEIRRALDVLKLDGILLPSSFDRQLIGVERFHSVLAELNRRRAVVHLHPTNSPDPVPGFGSSTPLDFPVETTRAVGSLLASGALHRYPDIQWIIAHGGGAFPYIVGRVARSDSSPELRERAPLGTAAYMRRLYYDVAVCCHPNALPSLLTVTDGSHLIFGTDMPAFSVDEVRAAIEWLETGGELTGEEFQGVAHRNAGRLFPRLAPLLKAG